MIAWFGNMVPYLLMLVMWWRVMSRAKSLFRLVELVGTTIP